MGKSLDDWKKYDEIIVFIKYDNDEEKNSYSYCRIVKGHNGKWNAYWTNSDGSYCPEILYDYEVQDFLRGRKYRKKEENTVFDSASGREEKISVLRVGPARWLRS